MKVIFARKLRFTDGDGMKRVLTIEWSSFPGATKKKRRISLKPDDEGVYVCPVKNCLKPPYCSQRGVRKHINR